MREFITFVENKEKEFRGLTSFISIKSDENWEEALGQMIRVGWAQSLRQMAGGGMGGLIASAMISDCPCDNCWENIQPIVEQMKEGGAVLKICELGSDVSVSAQKKGMH